MFRILLCLILGAITTVAVAWGSIYRSVDFSLIRSHIPLKDNEQPVWTAADDALARRSPVAFPPDYAIAGRTTSRRYNAAFEKTWPNVRARELYEMGIFDDGGTYSGRRMYSIYAGWPSEALLGRQEIHPSGTETDFRLAFSVKKAVDGPTGPFQMWIAFPICPIWPGFVIDLLFYAAIWFGVFFGFTSTKRFIRVRRGRCPRCGYNLRGARVEPPAISAGCPECGWNRETTTMALSR